MVSVEINKIESGSGIGFDAGGVVVEFTSDGAGRRQLFIAAHLIDALQAAGLDSEQISPPGANRSRLFVTKALGDLSVQDVYSVFRNTEGVDVSLLTSF